MQAPQNSDHDYTPCALGRDRRQDRFGTIGTDGSNPLSSSTESVSAVNSSAVGGEARGFAALCTCTGREKGRAVRDPAPFVPFSLTGIDAVPPREAQRVYNISSPTMAVCDPFAPGLEHWVSAARGT
jgi:hypothetical protein